MDYKKLNEILENVDYLEGKFKKISTQSDGGEDEEKITSIFEVGLEDVLLKIVKQGDSYGDNEKVISIQFVKQVTKTVNDYESL